VVDLESCYSEKGGGGAREGTGDESFVLLVETEGSDDEGADDDDGGYLRWQSPETKAANSVVPQWGCGQSWRE
jgi:hypothetical protein